MKPTEIDNGRWYVFTALGGHVKIGARLHEFRFLAGVKGYICRNEFDPSYYQIVAPCDDGIIAGWYLKASDADRLCLVTIPAPKFAHPERHWSEHWNWRR